MLANLWKTDRYASPIRERARSCKGVSERLHPALSTIKREVWNTIAPGLIFIDPFRSRMRFNIKKKSIPNRHLL